ncbi:hypothetical protein GGR53DRAFT_467992 [Hypoxylon sp. FL1150]|nr:hypothetical protein GGR53DRAFT_467992 [Hypoxylon sp. FL1150]
MGDSSQSKFDPEETFNRARDEFLAGLSDQDRSLYSPCTSPDDLIKAIEELKIITQSQDRRHQDKARRWIGAISRLCAALKPYLTIIDVFVSSNPEYAALVWGSLHLILQLASNYTEFFDKLTQLLSGLSESFSQYRRILDIKLRAKSNKLVQECVADAYGILLEIFHSAVRVFTKSDGKLKRTSIVIGQLMWKPFDIRFSDLVEKLERRHQTLFDELAVANLENQLDEMMNAEANRKEMSEEQKRNQEERKAAAEERVMAQKERTLAEAERRYNLDASGQMSSKLDTLLEKGQYTEDEYRGKLLSAARKGICPPNYADARDKASGLRLDGTATWVFDTPSFKSWVEDSPTLTPSTRSTFGGNVMWITDGQRKFTSAVVLELLQLCLRRGSILVLDGLDECRNLDEFLPSLRSVLEAHPQTRVLLLSRINVAKLKFMVRDQRRLEFFAGGVSTDIGLFFSMEIHELFDERMLPGSIADTDNLVQRLVRGADGMFLWARLMIDLLRSPSMTPYQRLEVIRQVSVPEGLEKLYERIFIYIASTGLRALKLASMCLAWLTRTISPMSSLQLREALIIQEHFPDSAALDDIIDFEEAVIMACAGLVIRTRTNRPQSPTFLTPVHISITEIVEELVTNRLWINQYLNHDLHCIIADCSAARMDLANCCLRKILNPECRDWSKEKDDAEELQSVTKFYSYASAWWLCYIKEAISKCQPITDMHPHVKLAVLEALSKLLALLSKLLEKPRALSSWLYEFYSSHLIIWDEMASFGNIQLFFNPGTTRVTFQYPKMPATRNHQQKLVTLVSKTTQNGAMKGVLSIWTSLYATVSM